jgi:hypothetical protein
MSSDIGKIRTYRCMCGESFNSLSQLEEHINELKDATDFSTHGEETAHI